MLEDLPAPEELFADPGRATAARATSRSPRSAGSCSPLELAIVEWVAWFNNDRLHESLGDLPPAEFEQLHAARPTLEASIAGNGSVAMPRFVVTIALVAALAAGCGSEGKSTKVGGAAAPVTLRIGTDDRPGKPAARQIVEFGRGVKALSKGTLRIEPVWHAAGDGPDWDQRNARMVMSGKLDMGLIPSRAWDTEGVTSLRALNAPFLVDNDELFARILSGELEDDLLSGLNDAGVVGLALFPAGLRHPFGLDAPVRGPQEYAGKLVRTPTSKTANALFEALGATPPARRQPSRPGGRPPSSSQTSGGPKCPLTPTSSASPASPASPHSSPSPASPAPRRPRRPSPRSLNAGRWQWRKRTVRASK